MIKIKVGFEKKYLLANGFEANFWAVGQRVFLYSENEVTIFNEAKQVKIDLLLYKDFISYINNTSTGIKQTVIIPYTIDELFGGINIIDICFERIKNNPVNTYFSDANIIEIELPENTFENIQLYPEIIPENYGLNEEF